MDRPVAQFKPKLKWYEVVLGLALSSFILVPPIAFYMAGRGTDYPITRVRQLSPDVPIKFPADALVLNGEYHSGLGACLAARVRFRKSEFHRFVSQPLLAAGQGRTGRELMEWSTDPQLKGLNWRIRSIHSYSAINNVECRPNDGNSQAYFLIDLDNPDYVDVYINRQYH